MTASTCRALRAVGRQWQTPVQPFSFPITHRTYQVQILGGGLPVCAYIYWGYTNG